MPPPMKYKLDTSHSVSKVRVRHSCSLKKLCAISKTLTDECIARIKGTPFRFLLDIASFEPSETLLHGLIDGWDLDSMGFRFAQTLVHFTHTDVTYLLGLRAFGTKVQVVQDYGKSRVHALLDIYFPDRPRNCKLVHQLFDRVESSDDVCRVYIAYAFCTFLFPLTSKGLHSHFYNLLDDIDHLNDYCWGGAVYEFLVDGIKQAVISLKENRNRFEIRIRGCSPLLELWALEHTLVIKRPISQWPRIFTWITKKLSNSIAKSIIYISDQDKVALRLQPSRKEKKKQVIKELLKQIDNDGMTPNYPPSPASQALITVDIHSVDVSPSHLHRSPAPPLLDVASESSHHTCKITYQHLLHQHKLLREEYDKKCYECDEFSHLTDSLREDLKNKIEEFDELMRLYKETRTGPVDSFTHSPSDRPSFNPSMDVHGQGSANSPLPPPSLVTHMHTRVECDAHIPPLPLSLVPHMDTRAECDDHITPPPLSSVSHMEICAKCDAHNPTQPPPSNEPSMDVDGDDAIDIIGVTTPNSRISMVRRMSNVVDRLRRNPRKRARGGQL